MGDTAKGVSTKGKKNIHLYLITAIISILLISFGVYIYSLNKLANSWDNRIYPGVEINGVDVSGKNKKEAEEILSGKTFNDIKNKILTLEANGEKVTIEYSKINPQIDIQSAVDKAFSYGKDENLFSKSKLIKNGVNRNVKLKLTYDEKIIKDYKDELNKKVNKPYKNATVDVKSGNVNIIPEEKGTKIDEDSLNKLLEENLNSDTSVMAMSKAVDVTVDEPTVTSKMLSSIDGKIGSSSTSYNASDWERTTNLRIATGHINGTILMPGESFSYNDVVGERLASRGFMNGAGFVGNKVVPTIGGGVCQVSTTLYQAVSAAGILPTERHQHSMLVSYTNPSEDAAVAWGYLDYKFKNTYDFPIYIEGYLQNNRVNFNIYGNKAGLEGKTYKLVGVTKTRGGSSAATSDGYLVTYKDGVEIDRKYIASDVYRKAGQ